VVIHALLVALALLAAAPAAAQIMSRPTDPPVVTASNESWYQLREPLQFAGELYYPAGPTIFFDGNRMVRVGHYNGVPLYADATVEPFSVVLVPVTRGLLQPYQRPRRGDLAGTTGSSAPAFPVAVVPGPTVPRAAAAPPTAPPLPPGAIGVFTPESTQAQVAPATRTDAARTLAVREAGSPRRSGVAAEAGAVGTTGVRTGPPIVTLRRPENNDGIWIQFGGERWIASGVAVPLSAAEFVRVGEHRGFPIFARQPLNEDVIYVPTRSGMVAPYHLKE
jgi:hypothetical protein